MRPFLPAFAACLLAACAAAPAPGGGGLALDAAAADAPAADAAAPDAAPPADTQAAADAPPADTVASPDVPAACTAPALSDLYEKKIKPLVTKGQPSTCNQCHLSGVDLGMFVQETPCRTMACMVEKGVVSLGDPPSSQVLQWLAKGKPQSALITAEVLANEKAAFLGWIEHSAQCQAATCGAIADPCGDAGKPEPVVPQKPMLGGCSEAALAQGFQTLVYKHRDRCSHCHSPAGKDYIKSGAPGWLSKDTTLGGSIYTMYNVIGLDVLDTAKPEDSLFLRKPLPKALNGGLVHGGGVKFQNKKDPTYVDFLKWIQGYAACVGTKP